MTTTYKNFKAAAKEMFGKNLSRWEVERGTLRDDNKKHIAFAVKNENAKGNSKQWFEGNRYYVIVDDVVNYLDCHNETATIYKGGIHTEYVEKTVRYSIPGSSAKRLRTELVPNTMNGVVLAGEYAIVGYDDNTVIWEKV